MLNFDARVKNSDAAQPRVTNVKTPIVAVLTIFCSQNLKNSEKKFLFTVSTRDALEPLKQTELAPFSVRSLFYRQDEQFRTKFAPGSEFLNSTWYPVAHCGIRRGDAGRQRHRRRFQNPRDSLVHLEDSVTPCCTFVRNASLHF